MIGLGLNGPQFARPGARDDVDSRVNTPPVRPVFPQPDFIELTSIPWSIFEEPFAEPLEVSAKRCAFRITADLRFDGLESAGRQSRLSCDPDWHVPVVSEFTGNSIGERHVV